MGRSINKVIIVGNMTRDPELRYTPQGHAVCSFGVATNREWTSDGEKKESAEFHNIVSWNKLAELCSQLLHKGTKVYVEGRLQTRDWVNDSGEKRYKTEIVIEEMVVLSSRRSNDSGNMSSGSAVDSKSSSKDTSKSDGDSTEMEDVASDEIPF